MERKKRSELIRQKWAKIVQNCCPNGKSITAWCLEHGISYSNFMYWRRRLRQPQPAPTFIELPENISTGHIEIEFHGVQLKIFPDSDPQTLLKCLQTIRRM